jgi:radical SAM protein with 4Fe4S-binding SPASM domain
MFSALAHTDLAHTGEESLPKTPKVAPQVLYLERNESHLFFNPQIPDWIVVSANCAYILSLCDGDRTVNDIVSTIGANGTAIDPTEIKRLLAFATARGILIDGCSAAAVIPDQGHSKGGLESIYLKLTNRCNLKCDYCYAASGPGRNVGEQTTEEWLTLIRQLRAISVDGARIALTGGEPMIRDDFERIAEYANSLDFRVSLITNGSLINETNVKRLASLFKSIQISLDGDESLHDKHRGQGAWKKARRAIDILVSAGAAYSVSLTMGRHNKDAVGELVREFGPRLRLGSTLPTGRAAGSNTPALENHEYVEAIRSSGAGGLFENVEFLESSRGHHRTHCGAGSHTLSIDERGNVFPCQILISKEMAGGNVKNGGLKSILDGSPWSALTTATVDSNPSLNCASCHVRYICGGGCKAKLYYSTSRFDGPDGLCQLWRESIINGMFKTAERPSSLSVFQPQSDTQGNSRDEMSILAGSMEMSHPN